MKLQAERLLAFLKRHVAAVSAIGIAVCAILILTVMTASLQTVTVLDDGKILHILTLTRDKECVLANAGITLQPQDVVTVSDSAIDIKRSFSVTVSVEDGEDTVLCVLGGTVADALKDANVNTLTHVLTTHTETELLHADMVIPVKVLENETRTVEETIVHETNLTYSGELPAGSRLVEQDGVNGKKTVVYRDYYKDGKLVTTEIVSETITKEPITEIATVGEGAVSIPPDALTLDANGVPTKYKSVLSGIACAYTAKEGARTATGTIPAIGTVAVNPKVIPYGSKLFIVSDSGYVYGYGVARDTGGGLLRNQILVDLYMDTRSDCFQFGKRSVKVYILE